MSEFHLGDRVRLANPGLDERLMVRNSPLLMLMCEAAGTADQLRHSLDVMPVPTGTVVGVDAIVVDHSLGITLRDAVLVDLDDGRKEFPYRESDLELIESIDDGLARLLSEGEKK